MIAQPTRAKTEPVLVGLTASPTAAYTQTRFAESVDQFFPLRAVSTRVIISSAGRIAMSAPTGYAKPEVLVETAWLADHLNDAGLRLIEANEDILLGEQGHIPAPQTRLTSDSRSWSCEISWP
jgi:hypothetical protein